MFYPEWSISLSSCCSKIDLRIRIAIVLECLLSWIRSRIKGNVGCNNFFSLTISSAVACQILIPAKHNSTDICLRILRYLWKLLKIRMKTWVETLLQSYLGKRVSLEIFVALKYSRFHARLSKTTRTSTAWYSPISSSLISHNICYTQISCRCSKRSGEIEGMHVSYSRHI